MKMSFRIAPRSKMAGGGAHADHYPDQQQQQHYGPSVPQPRQHYGPPEPQGELVSVFTEANPNYRLTVRDDGAVLAFKNTRDIRQHWVKVDCGPGRGNFVDREGQPGFILVSKATGVPLKHGNRVNDFVTTHKEVYGQNTQDGTIMWSLGRKDEGHGFKGMRAITNIGLNLQAEHADKLHGGVRDGNRLILSSWVPQENLKWKIEPVEELAPM